MEGKASCCLGRNEGNSGYDSNPNVVVGSGVEGAAHDNEIFLGSVQIGKTDENGILE
jgi:hypothetical protein